jgi:hypothetical protein
MKPRVFQFYLFRTSLEFFECHLRQPVIIDNSSASRLLALDDIARGRLRSVLAVNAIVAVNAWPKRISDEGGAM